jgi:hypothetical protein
MNRLLGRSRLHLRRPGSINRLSSTEGEGQGSKSHKSEPIFGQSLTAFLMDFKQQTAESANNSELCLSAAASASELRLAAAASASELRLAAAASASELRLAAAASAAKTEAKTTAEESEKRQKDLTDKLFKFVIGAILILFGNGVVLARQVIQEAKEKAKPEEAKAKPEEAKEKAKPEEAKPVWFFR